MKITTTNRNQYTQKRFMNGWVSPQESHYHNAEPVSRDPVAKGLVIHGTWYELPDSPDGDYVLIEEWKTNQYGYYEGGGSVRSLVSTDYVKQLPDNVAIGTIDQIAVIKIRGDQVDCQYNEGRILEVKC